MDRAELRRIAKAQLALDLGCEAELLDTNENVVFEWKDMPGRRKYSESTPVLEILIINGKLLAAATPALLPWCRANLSDAPAQWLFRPAFLRALETALASHGYEIGGIHHYFLPEMPFPMATPRFLVRWYEGEDLERFRGDERWEEALAFNPHTPDMLAVAAMDGQHRPMGMAGASRDGEGFWQIGINVLPEYRGQGMASNLTALLAQELLRRGIVPFYGTAESHILSQNTAIGAGFRPAFAYLYAQAKGN